MVAQFDKLRVLGDEESGSFGRFQAKANLHWVATDWSEKGLAGEVIAFAEAVQADLLAQGITHVEYRTFPIPELLEAFAHDRSPLTQRVVVTLLPGPDGSWSNSWRSNPKGRRWSASTGAGGRRDTRRSASPQYSPTSGPLTGRTPSAPWQFSPTWASPSPTRP